MGQIYPQMSNSKLSVIRMRPNVLRDESRVPIDVFGKAIRHVNTTAIGAQRRSAQTNIVVISAMFSLTAVPLLELVDFG
jgi:hypothetical protein